MPPGIRSGLGSMDRIAVLPNGQQSPSGHHAGPREHNVTGHTRGLSRGVDPYLGIRRSLCRLDRHWCGRRAIPRRAIVSETHAAPVGAHTVCRALGSSSCRRYDAYRERTCRQQLNLPTSVVYTVHDLHRGTAAQVLRDAKPVYDMNVRPPWHPVDRRRVCSRTVGGRRVPMRGR